MRNKNFAGWEMHPQATKHHISAEMYKSEDAQFEHPVFAIDGLSLDQWLGQRVAADWIFDLVPAQGWLIKDEEFALAWRRIERVEDGCSTIVPILVCPDDVDLSCSVIVVEQVSAGDEIIWCRFGQPDESRGDQCGATVKWFDDSPSCAFGRSKFEVALAEFKRLMGDEWK